MTSNPRASLEEVLEFCNIVREAGGGELITDLMPGEPGAATQCLIAKNLNFNCRVANGHIEHRDYIRYLEDRERQGYYAGEPRWMMSLMDRDTAYSIAAATGMQVYESSGYNEICHLLLPALIGRVASAFDESIEVGWHDEDGYYLKNPDLYEQMKPYITASEIARTQDILNDSEDD